MALITAADIGVRFSIGRPRDDTQSWAYRALARAHKPEAAFWALRHVSFTGHEGEVIGIIGGNGAGKTTLCRVLAGLIRPDEGTLHVGGRTSALLSLGTGFNYELSGHDNIYLNGLMLGLSRREIQRLVPDISAFSGLGAFLDQPMKLYSTGMRARLGFAIGAAIEPDVLILDETLSVGDLEFSARAGERLKELLAKAKLVVVVSHQLAFIEEHCSRVIWLEAGRVRATGLPREIAPEYEAAAPVERAPARMVSSRSTAAGSPARPAPAAPAAPAATQPAEASASPPMAATVSAATTPRDGASGQTGRAIVRARHLGVRFPLRGLQRAVRRRRREVVPLDDITLTLHEGEVLGVIGANGAGKSTLCRVISGLLKPDVGEIEVNGQVAALLTLVTGYNMQLSGRDNIYRQGLMLGMSRAELDRHLPDIIEFSGLARFIDEPLKHYSVGMRARLGFSTAAMLSADVLIADEILSAGDAEFKEKARTRILDQMARAKVVVLVSHDLAFVEAICTRALWLQRGRVMFDGPPAEAVAEYRRAVQSYSAAPGGAALP